MPSVQKAPARPATPAAKPDRILMAVIGVLLLAFSLVIADTIHVTVVSVGDKAPDFSITTDSGKRITRSDFGGRLLVLNFWATWCPPCLEEMPSLDRFQRELSGSGVVVVGISVDKNEKLYKDLLRRVNVKFETARDPDARISADYGTFKYPETYIINRQGEVIEKFIGPENWMSPNLVERIRRLL